MQQPFGGNVAAASTNGPRSVDGGSSSGDLHGGGAPSSSTTTTLPGGLPRGSGPRVYVGGVPTAVSETMVRAHFSQWGQVLDVYFPKDRVTGRRKNYCFVTFGSPGAADAAAARSNREIGRFRVEAISVTRDRLSHYEQVQRQQQIAGGVGGGTGGVVVPSPRHSLLGQQDPSSASTAAAAPPSSSSAGLDAQLAGSFGGLNLAPGSSSAGNNNNNPPGSSSSSSSLAPSAPVWMPPPSAAPAGGAAAAAPPPPAVGQQPPVGRQ